MFIFYQADNISELFQSVLQTELQHEALWDFNYRLFIKIALKEVKKKLNLKASLRWFSPYFFFHA